MRPQCPLTDGPNEDGERAEPSHKTLDKRRIYTWTRACKNSSKYIQDKDGRETGSVTSWCASVSNCAAAQGEWIIFLFFSAQRYSYYPLTFDAIINWNVLFLICSGATFEFFFFFCVCVHDVVSYGENHQPTTGVATMDWINKWDDSIEFGRQSLQQPDLLLAFQLFIRTWTYCIYSIGWFLESRGYSTARY